VKMSDSSRRSWRVLIAALLAALLVVSNSLFAAAQGTDDADQLSGRLGGQLAEIQERFGDPSWTDTNLIGYNSQALAGVDTIVVIYYDNQNIVNKISLVYLEKPAQFADPEVIADVVADVAPKDGTCSPLKAEQSGLGAEVYPCTSTALATVVTSDMMKTAGVKGDLGSYSYTVDPTADEYFEIIVQPGTDTDTPPPTAVPTAVPEPTAVPSLTDTYPTVPDVRELAIGRGYTIGDQLSLSGSVFNIEVDSDGTYMQIWVTAPDGSTEAVIVVYEGDSSGVFEGTWVTASGTYFGPVCGTNMMGGEVCQPAILADVLER
jgi:hypothetical protein